jgi:hypothetical protein
MTLPPGKGIIKPQEPHYSPPYASSARCFPFFAVQEKTGLAGKAGWGICFFVLILYGYVLIPIDYTGSSNTAQGLSPRLSAQAGHVAATDVIEISDSDELDSPGSTRVNQAPVNFPAPSLAVRAEVIEIFSSDAEDASQSPPLQSSPPSGMPQISPGMLRQSPEGLEIPIPPSTPPQVSFSPPQLPAISSPHEAENMMIGSSSPTLPAIPSCGFETVEDSEPEKVAMEDTHDLDDPQDVAVSPVDETVPPPPPISSSPSHLTPISRPPTPTVTVRNLLYGRPDGIFRDANASVLQHFQSAPNQDVSLSTPTLPLDAPLEVEAEAQPPPTFDAGPPVPEPVHRPQSPPVSCLFCFFLFLAVI